MAGQVVQITINVTDGNASEAVQQVVAQLNAIGPAGEAAGAAASAGLDQISTHALTSLDNVRLLRDDLGVRIPRSMEKAIASSQMLSGAINAMGAGLLAVGGADLFVHLAEGAYNLYEKYLDVNAAQNDFLKTMQENKDKDFINVHSIETAQMRITQATAAMAGLNAEAQSMSKQGILDIFSNNVGMGIGELLAGKKIADQGAKSAGQQQQLSPEEQNLLHQQRLLDIDQEHAADSELKGQQKITAELQKQIEIDKEKQRYTAIQEKERGNPGAPDAGKSVQQAEDIIALKKAMAQEEELHRQMTNEVIAMQNEATNAGLEGNALRAAQEQQSIDAIVRKYQEGEIDKQTAAAETSAVQKKFANEALKLQEQLDEQTKHLADEANQAGLKGTQLLAAQLQTQLDSINQAERKAVGLGGVETSGQSADFNSQRDSARQIFYQKGVEEQEQYQDKIQQLMNRSDDFELQGYARIDAETKQHLDQLAKADEEYYGVGAQAEAAYWQQSIQVEADAERERLQLHQKTMEQLTKEEQQTARELLPEWQQAMLAIEDTYTDRLHQIQQDVKQHVMTEQEGAQATVAAWQQANAQMQKSEEETRDKIASGLHSLFEHPEKFFEDAAMKSAFQLMANQMLSVFQSSGTTGGILQYLFGMGPQMSTSTNPLTAMSSALGLGGVHSSGTIASPSMMQFSQGSTTLVTGSQLLIQAASSLQSAAGAVGMSGGGGGGLGGGAFTGIGGLGNMDTSADASSAMGMPSFSTAGNMVGGSPMPQTTTPSLAGTLNADGSFTSAQGGGAGALGASMGILGGTLMAASSIYAANQDSNPIAGAVGGAMGGMEAGAAIGSIVPGIGTVVGGVIGAIAGGIGGLLAGIFGDKGRGQAEGLDVNTIQPEIAKDMQEYESGQTGYSAIAMDLSNLMASAKKQTTPWGSGARIYFQSNIEPEINAALTSIQKQQASGRSAVTLSAGQFHSGGWTGDFGDLATSEDEGFIHARANEFVVQPRAAMSHGPLLSAINSGSVTYSNQVQPRMPASMGGGGATITIQALDAKSVAQWAKAGGGRALVSAINQAQTQYSGIGR